MEVTITLIICLSVVFVITLGIVSCTLRDKNFKVRFDDRNKRMMRIIAEQRDELISYREAIKKKKDTEELLAMVKVELGDLNLGTDKISKKMDEAIRSFSSCVKKIENNNEVSFKHFEQYLVNRPSYLSPDEKKHFKKYMLSCARGYTYISNMPNKMDLNFVRLEDVVKALEYIGKGEWDSQYCLIPAEEDLANGQNTERNQ